MITELGMSQIMDVATWVALITGIVGISLAAVAIWFSFSVEAKSRRVSDQMIQSLQKIESYVERSSTDTRELIKVGWDRMLGGVSLPPDADSQESSEVSMNQITAGLAEELKSELRQAQNSGSSGIDEEKVMQVISEVVQAQARTNRSESPKRWARVEDWARILNSLSPAAYELVRILSENGHITSSDYNKLRDTNMKMAGLFHELRREGLLVPLVGTPESVQELLVYWFPPGESRNISMAMELVDRRNRQEYNRVSAALQAVGYFEPVEQIASEVSSVNGSSEKAIATEDPVENQGSEGPLPPSS
jgi:hypothetical protein